MEVNTCLLQPSSLRFLGFFHPVLMLFKFHQKKPEMEIAHLHPTSLLLSKALGVGLLMNKDV
jgi:hypothetical protein